MSPTTPKQVKMTPQTGVGKSVAATPSASSAEATARHSSPSANRGQTPTSTQVGSQSSQNGANSVQTGERDTRKLAVVSMLNSVLKWGTANGLLYLSGLYTIHLTGTGWRMVDGSLQLEDGSMVIGAGPSGGSDG